MIENVTELLSGQCWSTSTPHVGVTLGAMAVCYLLVVDMSHTQANLLLISRSVIRLDPKVSRITVNVLSSISKVKLARFNKTVT